MGRRAILLLSGVVACNAVSGASDLFISEPSEALPEDERTVDGAPPGSGAGDGADASDGGDADARFRVRPDGGLFVFVTSTTTRGSFGGVEAGDLICNQLATSANLGGSWLAWLSSSRTPSAAARLTSGTAFYLVTGELVATSSETLLKGSLQRPIDRTETGAAILESHAVWTGTSAEGRRSGANCEDWSTTLGFERGLTGSANQRSTAWTAEGIDACTLARRLYCFEKR